MPKRSTHLENSRPSEVRCAIYTRKSSEEGLEQEFNSLHAQREACQAYILSQRHEGWRTLSTLYDDGGISGGTMERAALKRLLDDIRAKRIDLVVIYKVDRLTRSLADFAKLVDIFNDKGVSFVSVTQQFNTATSMGRLTLNMLLSFAQFEREVTGERIRDKIAASKRKGMWMGGHPPLGYDVRDRKLVVNEAEAEQVRDLFRTYVHLGSVRLLCEQLAQTGVTSKKRFFANGREGGGRSLLRGNVYEMLRNHLYLGEIAHKGNIYSGEHQAIIDQALWDEVQAVLSSRRAERFGGRNSSGSLLAGIVFDGNGERLTPTHAKKGTRRYRYYVSRQLIVDKAAAASNGFRIPAGELETLVIGAVRDLVAAPTDLMKALESLSPTAAQQHEILSGAATLTVEWKRLGDGPLRLLLQRILSQVQVHTGEIKITVSPLMLISILTEKNSISVGEEEASRTQHYTIVRRAALRRCGQELRLVVQGDTSNRPVDPALAKLIHQGLQFRDALLSPRGQGIAELAAEAGVSGSHFTRVMRLGLLAPDILTAIAHGLQPPELTATRLLRDTRLPLAWADQRIAFGFPNFPKTI